MTDSSTNPSALPPARSAQKPRIARLLAIALVTAVVAGGAFFLYARLTRIAPPVTPKTVSLESPYRNEEDWLVTRIAEDLWGLAAFAANGRTDSAVRATTDTDASGQLTVRVGSPGKMQSAPLPLTHSVWAPEDYQPLASQLVENQGARPATPVALPVAPSADEALLRHLLDRRAEAIDDENWAISKALARQPAEPRLHEDAALVLGAFALREAAGEYSDLRFALCRMTAHLAFARALRGSSALGLSGRYAEAVLSTLADREAEAEEALSRLAATAPDSPVQQAWRNALKIRITEDWRLLPQPGSASRLELFEWLRATQSTLSGERALRMLERAGVEPGPEVDWTMALAQSPSVGIGNVFLDSGLDALLAEGDLIWSKSHDDARLLPDRRIAALNEPAQLFVSSEGARVIAWGTWAAQYQRHALQLMRRIELHERRALGLPDRAKRTVTEKTRAFSALTLFPALATPWEAEKKKPDPRILDAAVDLVVKHPELVAGYVWSSLANTAATQALPRRLPERITWFSTGCPRGTSFEADLRLYILPRKALSAYAAHLVAISPRDYDVAFCSLSDRYNFANHPPPDVVERAFGQRLEYDMRALFKAATWSYERDPAATRRLEQRMCEIDADQCYALGAWCVDQGDESCALTAFERFVAEGADEVRVSSGCDWLLWHYLRKGERKRAGELAQRAAAVGSGRGLIAMASFLEATGQYARAEDYIQQEHERYPTEDDSPHWGLIAFYHRMAHVRGMRSYEAKFASVAKEVFPNGVERIELSSLQAPPTDGVLFETETAPMRNNGLHKGDVAVAWDGWRVRNQWQFRAAREFSDDPSFKLIVWRAGEYLEVSARRVRRHFENELRDYVPKPQVGGRTSQR